MVTTATMLTIVFSFLVFSNSLSRGKLFAHGATVPEDWRDRLDLSVLESRESEIGQCNLQEQLSVPEGDAFASAVEPTGQLFPDNYWPNKGKNIPYEISDQFGSTESGKIRHGLLMIRRRTFGCITFIKRTTETDFIFFRPGRLCQSRVGKSANGGRHDIELSHACTNNTGIVQHEVLHALGLFHEQNRPDRDQYVTIYQDNIQSDFVYNFRLLPDMAVYGTLYDLESIMHYGAYDFAKVRSPTIVPKGKKKVRMGQRKGLSVLDVTKLHTAYACTFDTDNEETDDSDSVTVSSAATPRTTTAANEPFPEFSQEPMTRSQCSFQFGQKCGREHYSLATCTQTKGLEIDCKGLTADELTTMVTASATVPVRPVRVDVDDGEDTVTPSMFAPIRLQVIGFELWNCKTSRTTEKLRYLKFSRMYHFEAARCRNLNIQRSDFDTSKSLRLVLFRESTISRMEEETFMNLPELQLLSFEYERSRTDSVPTHQQDFVTSLHCRCQFAWLRRWFHRKPSLLLGKRKGGVYSVDNAFTSPKIHKEEMYRTFDCKSNQPVSLDDRFSVSADECPNR